MHILKKLIFAVVVICLWIPPDILSVSASVPYHGYNYSYWEQAVPAAIPYQPNQIIDGRDTEYGLLRAPEDIFVTDNGFIYILDSGNDRIVILNEHFEFIREIDQFANAGVTDTFSQPQGIFVTENNHIFVADTNNQRIVELTADAEFIREITRPDADVIRAGFEFYPTKVAVDKAGRIYAIGRGVFDGLIEFDSDGVFTGFTGANRVTFNPIDYLWRVIATREQRSRMALFIPIEFNNLALDQSGFIYTTNSELNSNTPIQRLNPTGEDVIRREGYHPLVGDLEFAHIGDQSGGSFFVDITVNDYGMYSALDGKRGRIFSYDEDGNLLYIFGGIGNQEGTFRTPVAIDYLADKLLVLDKGYSRLTVFDPTQFGYLVNQAVMHYNLGDDDLSAQYWQDVLRLNANYEIAYIGIGKALLMEGENKAAMTYFDNGHNRFYYSKAYKRYRQEVLREHFGLMMGLVLLVPASYFGFKIVKRRRKKVKQIAKRAV
ncbi:NHL repeat-containing protein [Amphibacillus marinus]|uniref:NHL repeat-containing protein n=1 Tax=Amphibacillus marinus TaxID=872970 RepID=A0A1H8MLP3_9BACI|nr:NHL repeat-containing protein [Amphibacillus marinus]SEO18237.1 NHL repeat-containing protein [Amphibacillus marinus]